MKIGIITVHDSANFGSYLQAFALKTTLEEMGHDVEFIRTRTRKEAKKVFMGSKKNLIQYVKSYTTNLEKYNIFVEDINDLPEINEEEVNPTTIDLIIIGSDELWNVRKKVFTRPCFYGMNQKNISKITYAVSIGQAILEDFKKYSNLVQGIKEIDSILVRDTISKNVIEELTQKQIAIVCDPTFLIDLEKFEKPYQNPVKQDYILIYSYNFTKKQEKNIKKFAKENNLAIVSVCLKHNWSDFHINCSPKEFCQVIKEAKYVVTTTFHGTIFSILNKKQFICMPVSPKTQDVLNRTDMKEALYTGDSYEEFKHILQKKLDFEQAERRIEQMRRDSRNILQTTIEKYMTE